MKKGLVLGALAIASFAFAQRVQKGEGQINAGVGIGNSWGGIPVYVGYDYGVHKDVTVGVQGSFSSKNEKYTNGTFSNRWFSVGVNGNYHFNSLLKIPNNWDLYAGASLVYNSFSYGNKDYAFETAGSGIGFAGQIGGRYYFTNNLGVNLEFGGGDYATGGKVGISYKF